MAARGCRADRGFTLIELLVAMVILAITAVLVFDGLRLGTRSWALVDERADRTEQMRLVQAFIRAQLEQAQAFRYEEEAGAAQISFSGESDALRWVAPFPAYVGQGGMYWFTLEKQVFNSRTMLIVRYELYQPEGWERYAEEDEPEIVVLHEDIEEVEFAYKDSGEAGGQGTWQESWTRSDKLPGLVRMRLRPRDASAPAWPDVVVSPKAALPRVSG